MAETKSKILIVGSTGFIGKHLVEASAKAGRPTFALVREPTLSNPAKSKIIERFKALGVNFVLVSSPAMAAGGGNSGEKTTTAVGPFGVDSSFTAALGRLPPV
ncbi:hypothetical protein ACLB2K_016766 [Fragaria x ananassa]